MAGEMTLGELELLAAVCRQCALHETRTHPVFAKGNPESKLLICGMVPGPEEDKVGIPFFGRAGQLLDKILLATHLTLDNVYITNLVKCWLQPGLNLQPNWIASCMPYLIAQLSIIQPYVVITLGLPASTALLGLPAETRMGFIRGKVYTYSESIKMEVIPTYHPSYLLRKGGESSDDYPKVLDDFELANYILKGRGKYGKYGRI